MLRSAKAVILMYDTVYLRNGVHRICFIALRLIVSWNQAQSVKVFGTLLISSIIVRIPSSVGMVIIPTAVK